MHRVGTGQPDSEGLHRAGTSTQAPPSCRWFAGALKASAGQQEPAWCGRGDEHRRPSGLPRSAQTGVCDNHVRTSLDLLTNIAAMGILTAATCDVYVPANQTVQNWITSTAELHKSWLPLRYQTNCRFSSFIGITKRHYMQRQTWARKRLSNRREFSLPMS